MTKNLSKKFEDCWSKVCKEYKESIRTSWNRKELEKLSTDKEEAVENALEYSVDYAWCEADLVLHLGHELLKSNLQGVDVHMESYLSDFGSPLKEKLDEFIEKMGKKCRADIILKRKWDFTQFEIVGEVKFWDFKNVKHRKLPNEKAKRIEDELEYLNEILKRKISRTAYLCILDEEYAEFENEIRDLAKKFGGDVQFLYFPIRRDERKKLVEEAWDRKSPRG